MQRQKIIVAIAINTTIPEIIPIIAPIEILFEEALDRLVPGLLSFDSSSVSWSTSLSPIFGFLLL